LDLGRLFVQMALLYPWATKEYLLWHCTIGQIVLYHNLGIEMKYGKRDPDDPGIKTADKMTPAELKAKRDELRTQFGDING